MITAASGGNMKPIFDDVVNTDPEIVSGATCFKGTRVPIQVLFDHLEAGNSLETFFEDFPAVTREQAQVILTSKSNLRNSKPKKGAAAAVQEYLKNQKPLLNGISEEVNAVGKEFRENLNF